MEPHDDPAATISQLASLADPRSMYKELRKQPVHRLGEMFTLVTRREHVEEAFRNKSLICLTGGPMDLGNVRPMIPLQIDPPKHVKYRRVLDPLFAPQRMALLEGDIAALANNLIDSFISKGSCDLHEDFAVALPGKVFLRLLGLPYADHDFFLGLKDSIVRPPGATLQEQAPYRRRAAKTIYEYFERVIATRRASPTDDVLTQVMMSTLDGEKLSTAEVLDICFEIIIAGLDTVTDALDCIFAFFAQEEEQLKLVVEDESVIPAAVEELLRWESPVPAVPRVTTTDIEIGGCPIQTGTQLMLLVNSANTDDDAHPGLDRVDLRRNPNPHLTFGAGVHRCLGSHLARLELRVAVREFHRRIPKYSLAPGTILEYTEGLRSLHALPLVFEPVGS